MAKLSAKDIIDSLKERVMGLHHTTLSDYGYYFLTKRKAHSYIFRSASISFCFALSPIM